MANFQLIINKANEILALANNAKNLQDLAGRVVSENGGFINPTDENGNKLGYEYLDTTNEVKTALTNHINEIESNILDLETDIDELADDIKSELA